MSPDDLNELAEAAIAGAALGEADTRALAEAYLQERDLADRHRAAQNQRFDLTAAERYDLARIFRGNDELRERVAAWIVEARCTAMVTRLVLAGALHVVVDAAGELTFISHDALLAGAAGGIGAQA